MSSSPRCLVRGSISPSIHVHESLTRSQNGKDIDEFFHLPHIAKPGETISSTSYEKRAGGKGANQAYALARAGGVVELEGYIGEDGEWVKGMLGDMVVGVERILTARGEVTGRAIIQSSADGENSIVLHAGANFHVGDNDHSPRLTSFTHLLLQNEIPLTTTISHLRAAGMAHLTTVFNPSPMLTASALRDFPWTDLTWLIVNEGELESLLEAFGVVTVGRGSKGLRERAEEELHALHGSQDFASSVSIICTLGSQGMLYLPSSSDSSNEEPVGYLQAAKLERPLKDTTGAGDCFAGYFVAGLMNRRQGEALQEILQTCLIACAMCVEDAGAMESIPGREEVVKRSEESGI